jgi:adenylate cyclase
MSSNRRELPDHSQLRAWLSERNQFPERAGIIDANIERAFQRNVAILVLDLCGFSAQTLTRGIIHYLSLIEQMVAAATPAVEGNGGKVCKLEADNLFAHFPTPALALEASIDILRSFDALNSVVGPDRDIHASIGIGFGPTLLLDGQDLFGPEMNLACRLGEDLASCDEVLLTPAAFAALPPRTYLAEIRDFSRHGQKLEAYRFLKKLHPPA